MAKNFTNLFLVTWERKKLVLFTELTNIILLISYMMFFLIGMEFNLEKGAKIDLVVREERGWELLILF